VDHRCDRDPGRFADFTGGDVVAIVVDDILVVAAVDQVPSLGAVGGGFGVGAGLVAPGARVAAALGA
jgi:hypothetical protein